MARNNGIRKKSGCKKITELGSGKVLTGIAKRMVKDVANESFEDPEDFDVFQ